MSKLPRSIGMLRYVAEPFQSSACPGSHVASECYDT